MPDDLIDSFSSSFGERHDGRHILHFVSDTATGYTSINCKAFTDLLGNYVLDWPLSETLVF